MLKNLIFFIIISFFFSCKHKLSEQRYEPINDVNRDSINIINIDTALFNIKKDFKISKLFNKIEYLILEGNQYNPVYQVDKIKYFEGKYFIADFNLSKTFFAFSSKGHFLFKIDTKNKHGLLSIDDFSINSKLKQINILCTKKNRVFKYSMEGQFISSHNIPSGFTKIENFNDGKYMLYRSSSYSPRDIFNNAELVILNENFTFNTCYFSEVFNKKLSFENSNCFNNNTTNILFNRIYTPEIFEIHSDNKIFSKYYFNTDTSFLLDARKSDDYGAFAEIIEDQTFLIETPVELKKKLFFNLINKGKVVKGIYFIDSQWLSLFSSYLNDIDEIPISNFMDVNKEFITTVLPGYIVEEMINLNKKNTGKPAESLLNIYKNIKNIENPVIVKLYLK
ncbi:6-bladed beta-propeller [Sphingobacterium sp. UDSM-2020]|uniref:6-bladed beta-propeller n=1 Tax=Sphingobacterium sp. UDSM-2020 TaxID=2795738 RepID=UPI001937FB3F|nr:6-bladed beta-propeller [Sphingobacterium sp. UDSM-2020]QQD13384.1 6-bladed beta-propeller [Sphingobacterium sp. UDSM-2020]